MAYVEAINTNLQTDQDFADAEANVKFCKNAEDELKRAKSAALSSTVDIDELMKAVDYLSDQLRQKRLTLEKLVKSEKDARKTDIVHKAKNDYLAHVLDLEHEMKGFMLPLNVRSVDFYEAMKGKRTIESLNNAVNTCMAQSKIDADKAAKAMRDNLTVLNDLADGTYDHLFKDMPTIIHKEKDDFTLLVSTRVDQEKSRIQKAIDDKAEQERIANEAKNATKEPAPELPDEADPEKPETDGPADLVDEAMSATRATAEPPVLPSLSTQLKFWAFDHGVPDEVVGDLVGILNNHGHDDLSINDVLN